MCLLKPKLCWLSTAFMHSSELEGAVLLGNTLLSPGNLWIWRWLLHGHSKGLSEVFNCHKIGSSGAVSRKAESMFRGNICSNRSIPKYIFRMTFLFLPSTGINYFSAFCGNLVLVFIKFIFVSFYLLMPFFKKWFCCSNWGWKYKPGHVVWYTWRDWWVLFLVISNHLSACCSQGTGGIKGVGVVVPASSRADTQSGEVRLVYIDL